MKRVTVPVLVAVLLLLGVAPSAWANTELAQADELGQGGVPTWVWVLVIIVLVISVVVAVLLWRGSNRHDDS